MVKYNSYISQEKCCPPAAATAPLSCSGDPTFNSETIWPKEMLGKDGITKIAKL